MKIIITTLFLFLVLNTRSQSSDLIYVPDQKTLVASYSSNYNRIGLYMGGYITTSFPAPYIYTTPLSIINRIGLTFGDEKCNVMAGGYVESFGPNNYNVKPDLWIKIYPLRIITNTRKGFDFIFAINYMDNFRYGVGITIPFRGIY